MESKVDIRKVWTQDVNTDMMQLSMTLRSRNDSYVFIALKGLTWKQFGQTSQLHQPQYATGVDVVMK